MKFGLTLPQRAIAFDATSVAELLELARRADADPNIDSLWIGDSVAVSPRLDAVGFLGALAAVTSRARLGVACMASFPIRDPVLFAFQWASLDVISGGRMQLVACTGITGGSASTDEGRPWGVENRHRPRRLEEGIEICRQLWTGQQVTFDGSHFQLADAHLSVLPLQQPCPIWIAANPHGDLAGDRATAALARVARIADGWMTVEMATGEFGRLWEALKGHLATHGRDSSVFPTSLYFNMNIAADAEAALEESSRFIENYYDMVMDPQLIAAWTAAGPPERCIERLRELAAAGVGTVMLRLTSWDQIGQYERLVSEVLPHV